MKATPSDLVSGIPIGQPNSNRFRSKPICARSAFGRLRSQSRTGSAPPFWRKKTTGKRFGSDTQKRTIIGTYRQIAESDGPAMRGVQPRRRLARRSSSRTGVEECSDEQRFSEDPTESRSTALDHSCGISRDGGDNWDKPYAITSFDATSHPTHPSTDGNSDVAVSGAAIVVITEDYRDQGSHGRYDEVYADVSLDAGKTWQKTVQISSTVDNTDTDDNALGCQNGVFVINWYEDLGKGNSDNQSFVVAGSAADIAKGTLTPVNLSALGGAKDHQLCENIAFNNGGQFIVVSGEAVGNTSKGTSEASFISWSSDAGKTWKSSYGSEGERDVDEPVERA